jgi:arginase family enzyme
VAGVVALLGRTSERDETAQGARELGELLGARLVGEVAEPRVGRWDSDLREGEPVLRAAREAVLDGTRTFVAGHCNLAIATLPALADAHVGLRVAWLDAHADFNTPETSPSGFLGGMPLAAACGVWDAGLRDPPLDPAAVHLVGVRDVDPGERELLDTHGVREGPPESGPVFVHLDLDVLDPALMPAAFGVDGGWTWEELDAALLALPDVVGIEVTGCAPGHAARVADTLARL